MPRVVTTGLLLRATIVAAALVLPATGLGTLLHFTLVEHTVCVDHGTLTHGSEHVHVVSEPPDDSVTERTTSPGHGHHHCAMASFTRDAHGHGSTLFTVAVEASVASAANAGSVLAPAVPLLHLAPKSSPPA